MRILIIIISFILILFNVIAGIILKEYLLENNIASSCVILINAILLLLVHNSEMKDAFKVSYSLFFPFLGVVEFVLAILAPNTWEDNIYFVCIMGIIVLQLVMFFAANKITKYNQQYD